MLYCQNRMKKPAYIFSILLFLGSCQNQEIYSPSETAEVDRKYQDIDRINTAGWEDSPFVTPDGERFFFMYTPYSFWDWIQCASKGGDVQRCGKLIKKRGPDRPNHISDPNPFNDSNIYVAQRQTDGTWGRSERVIVGCCMTLNRQGNRI